MKASEMVRTAIRASRLSLQELARRSGVQTSALSRFMHGQRTITLETFESLAGPLRLRVVRRGKRGGGK